MNKTGKIIKSIAGFYEVYTEGTVYRCRARGVFRSLGVKPLVGDNVEIEITDETSVPKEGNVIRLLPRSNALERPNVANVDQALVIFAVKEPDPSFNMLDRFLIAVQMKGLPAVLCFNKKDLAAEEELAEVLSVYRDCGSKVLFVSASETDSLTELFEVLKGRTTVLTGPSGAGKSTLINAICPGAKMQTGELSRKISRGKNTTRHVELLTAAKDTYLVDTPGFTSLYLPQSDPAQLRLYYHEFDSYEGKCRFLPCMHGSEPGCAVKRAVEEGAVSRIRYEDYRALFEEMKTRKPIYRKRS